MSENHFSSASVGLSVLGIITALLVGCGQRGGPPEQSKAPKDRQADTGQHAVEQEQAPPSSRKSKEEDGLVVDAAAKPEFPTRPTYESPERLGAALIESLRDDDIDKFMSTCVMPEDVDKIVDKIVGSADDKEKVVVGAKEHFARIRKAFPRSRELILRRGEELGVTWDTVVLRAVLAEERNSEEPTPTVKIFNRMRIVLTWEEGTWEEGQRTIGIRMGEGVLLGDSWRFADGVISVKDLRQPVTGFNLKPYGARTVPLNPPER